MRTFKGALVLLDYPNQPFVVTQPQGSTVFGNPSAEASGIPRDQVAQFYQDFLNTPNQLNRGHTLHEYWMEDSGGRYGVDLTGVRAVPDAGQGPRVRDGVPGRHRLPGRRHVRPQHPHRRAAPPGSPTSARRSPEQFDFVFFLSAGQDESSTWQEFGPMKFPTKEDVTDEFGPPDPALPNWVDTRYVEWTSWASGSTIWPNAGGGSSTQAESSGMSVFAHEFSHILGHRRQLQQPVRRSRPGAPTAGSGRCSAAARSTARAARTAAG